MCGPIGFMLLVTILVRSCRWAGGGDVLLKSPQSWLVFMAAEVSFDAGGGAVLEFVLWVLALVCDWNKP